MFDDKVLIKNTTKIQREKFAKIGLSYSLLGADYPSKAALDLVNEYVEGNIEITEVLERVVMKYRDEENKNG